MEDFDRVMNENRVFVLFIAKRLKARLPACIEMDCLVAAGFVGLWKAFLRYDPAKSKFKTFASRRIYGEMIDWMRTESGKKGGRKFAQRENQVSLNLPYESLEEEEPETLQDFLAFSQNPNEVDSMDEFRALLISLFPKEREVARLIIIEGLTLKEVGQRFQISESRVCQIWKKIKGRLRENVHD